jgi:hypothetical protein
LKEKQSQTVRQLTIDAIKTSDDLQELCSKLTESLKFYKHNWNCFAFKEYLGRVCIRGDDKKFIYLQIFDLILALFRD